PTWPGGTSIAGFDWSSLLYMMFPVMMLGTVVAAAKPKENEREPMPTTVTEERKLLPEGRQEDAR
ncbi:MAG: hypothetical protein M0P55_14755, partial [Clostridiales bacterium]|nr:hypothetical protein [Clostridiales bacterium]